MPIMTDSSESPQTCSELLQINEIYIVNIPSLLFILTGPINFYFIRSIGFNRVVKYSTLFKVKRYVCWSIILLNLIKFGLTIFYNEWWASHLSKVAGCDVDQLAFAILRAVSIFIWWLSVKLMVY